MESAIVSASSISSYINVSCTISLITVSPPHWLYPVVQGEGHHSLSSLFIVFLPPHSLNRFTLSPPFSSRFSPPCFFPSFLSLPLQVPSLHLILYTPPPFTPFLILPSCLFASHGDASLAAPMKQVNFLPARRMNKSPWLCSERWGYLSKWSVSSSAQRHRLSFFLGGGLQEEKEMEKTIAKEGCKKEVNESARGGGEIGGRG